MLFRFSVVGDTLIVSGLTEGSHSTHSVDLSCGSVSIITWKSASRNGISNVALPSPSMSSMVPAMKSL